MPLRLILTTILLLLTIAAAPPPPTTQPTDLVSLTIPPAKPWFDAGWFNDGGNSHNHIDTVLREHPDADPPPKAPHKLMVPRGTTNLALRKPVASSDDPPLFGSLDMLTDGDYQDYSDKRIELSAGPQWIQIDLGSTSPLHCILLWHDNFSPTIYHAVIVQTSNDPQFKDNVHTLFNNDARNVHGQGPGKDREYVTPLEGKLINAKAVSARYIRIYSNGNAHHDQNQWSEIQVFGLPTTRPSTK